MENKYFFDQAEKDRERIKAMIKLNEQRADYGRCSTLMPVANPNYGTCAQIPNYLCGMTYQPAYEPPKSDQEIYYRSISNENQKLLQEKQRNLNQILALQNELRIVKEENYNYKIKTDKKKLNIDIVVYNVFTKMGIGIKTIYQNIINWFNT